MSARSERTGGRVTAGEPDGDGVWGRSSHGVACAGEDELVDEAARRRVYTDGLAETLFVEAGAGSGKTTVLVQRLANLVVQRGVSPASVAAITFTEAAATELRDRIRREFESGTESPDGAVRDRCQFALDELDKATITTLHGFALRIITEHPTAAGLPPRLEVQDEVSSQLAREERWARFVDRLHDDPANEELLLRADVLGVALERRSQHQKTFADTAAALEQNWDRLGPAADQHHTKPGPIDLSRLDHSIADLDASLAECREPSDRLYVWVQRVLAELREIVQLDDPLLQLERLDKPKWSNRKHGLQTVWSCVKESVYERLGEAAAAAKEIHDAAQNDVLRRLVTLVSREILDAANERRLEGRVEFHDLLVLARTMLRDSESARRSLHGRYEYLLLDEFQDTDPLQIELATLITGTIDEHPSSWQEIDVESGRLFFVGDPKQSIYRFRRADIALFLEARDRFSTPAGAVALTTNFRTVEPVVAWVNELFDRLMPMEVPGSQPRYVPLSAHRPASPAPIDHRPVLLGGPCPDTSAPARRQAEAAAVAEVLVDVRDHPERWPVLDPEMDEWRHARLPDVTVLIPTRASLPYLQAALDGVGVAYRLDTGSLVFSSQEVTDVLAAVRAVDDSSDAISLVTTLRSPLYACSDVDLFTWRNAGGRWELQSAPPAGLEDHPVASAFAHLRSLWDERWWIGPAALVERLVRERQAQLAAFGADRPRDVWRRLRFLVDQARAFEDSGRRDLRSFVAWAELQRAEGSRVHEPSLPERDDEGVRIMTVHGAKGLEFPITVVSGMTNMPTTPAGRFQVIFGADDAPPEVAQGSRARTDAFDQRADLEVEMDADEKLRQLYVAATRARDHLVISAFHGTTMKTGGDGSFGAMIWEECQAFPHLWRHVDDVVDRAVDPVVEDLPANTAGAPREPFDSAAAVDERRRWIEQRAATRTLHSQRHTLSATGVAKLGTVIAAGGVETDVDDDVDAIEPSDEPDGGDTDTPAWRRGRAGTAIGRAVHATLQSLDLLIEPDDPLVDTIAAREAALEVVPELADQVADNVRSALRSEAVGLARRYPHHKEMFVAAPVGDRSVEGYVDLLIEGPEGLIVVDYKTDTVRSEADVDAKLDYYEVQGAVYAVAIETATERPVVECRFVFCKPGGAIERTVGDLDAAKRRVTDRLSHT